MNKRISSALALSAAILISASASPARAACAMEYLRAERRGDGQILFSRCQPLTASVMKDAKAKARPGEKLKIDVSKLCRRIGRTTGYNEGEIDVMAADSSGAMKRVFKDVLRIGADLGTPPAFEGVRIKTESNRIMYVQDRASSVCTVESVSGDLEALTKKFADTHGPAPAGKKGNQGAAQGERGGANER